MDNTQEPAEILVESGVGYPSLRPFVNVRLGQAVGQMTPAAAREHALNVLAAADAAESDVVITKFLKERVGLTNPDHIAAVLADFRVFREQAE